MKNKVIWTMALSILIFCVFLGVMSRCKDNGIFYLKDLEGQREYLNLFPIEGVAGDGTHGITFRLEEGELSSKFYPIDVEQIKTLFFAEREGIKGYKKYNYDYYNQDFYRDVFISTDAAPSKDANLQHKDSIHEAALEEMAFNNEKFIGGETVLADKVDVYLNLLEVDGGREIRVRSGMTLQDKMYYFTRGDYSDGTGSYHQSFFYDMQIDGTCIELEGAYYCMALPNKECRGETTLFRMKKESMIETLVPPHEELYQQKEYGKADALCAFPVDEDNRVLQLFAVGEHALGIFRIQGESLIFEAYDTEGKMIAQNVITKELGRKVDQIETNVVAWNENDASIYFTSYQVVKQEDDTEVWEGVVDGMFQFDEKGLKRMDCCSQEGGKLLSVCKNNLILDVSMVSDEETQLPYYYGYQVYLTVINGDTGKTLYRGRFETDYDEDIYKVFSPYNISKGAPYLEEAMKTYYDDILVTQRQRQIMEILPINGKVDNIWWR